MHLALADTSLRVFLNCNSVACRDTGSGNLFSVRRTFRIKVPVLRDITSSGPLNSYRRFGSVVASNFRGRQSKQSGLHYPSQC